jgi:peptidoglycan/LPS O-acetylase OafA/YrhL
LRRYPRLTVPIVAISAVACALMFAGLVFNHDAAAALHSQNNLGDILRFTPSLKSLLRFSLFDVYFHYRTETSYNTNLWTMPVEYIGSMMVFAVLAATPHRWRRSAIAGLLAIGLFRGSMYADFFIGVALADLKTSRALDKMSEGAHRGLAIVCLTTAVVLRWRLPDWGWMFAVSSGLVVAAPLVSSPMRRWFESPLSRWLGRVSFPLYLVHPIVIVTPASWLALWLFNAGLPNLLLRDLVIATTILLSLATARLFLPVETVAIGLARRFSEVLLRQREPQRA